MNLAYTLTDQKGNLPLSDVPEKTSTLRLPSIKAWKEIFDMHVVELVHETQKTGFEIHNPNAIGVRNLI